MLSSTCDLPNPHKKCIREILNSLICQEHDYRRLTIELSKLNEECKREIDKVKLKCATVKKPQCSESEESLFDFKKQMRRINNVQHCYQTKMETLTTQRNEIFKCAQQCLIVLITEKYKFKMFHERSVAHITETAAKAGDPEVVRSCEKDIVQLNKLFAEEVFHIKKLESELALFINELKMDEEEKFEDACQFDEYDWLVKGKSLKAIDEMAGNVKTTMGATLRRAFAMMHLQKPDDKKVFLATYLFDLQQKEKLIQRKLSLFASNSK